MANIKHSFFELWNSVWQSKPLLLIKCRYGNDASPFPICSTLYLIKVIANVTYGVQIFSIGFRWIWIKCQISWTIHLMCWENSFYCSTKLLGGSIVSESENTTKIVKTPMTWIGSIESTDCKPQVHDNCWFSETNSPIRHLGHII